MCSWVLEQDPCFHLPGLLEQDPCFYLPDLFCMVLLQDLTLDLKAGRPCGGQVF